MNIWCNVKYPGEAMRLLGEVAAGHQLTAAAELSEAEARESLASADVAFGQPDAGLVINSLSLRWVHLDSAGYDRFDNDAMRAALRARGAVLTNSSGVYDEPCAEHLLAMMMALARRLPEAAVVQRESRAWPMMELRAASYLLRGQTAMLLGYGAIIRRLVELLAPFRMNLIAVRRRKTGDEPVTVITEAELEAHLPRADHVVSALPANAGTEKFVNAARLAAMKPGAVFYNVGRGSTVDQDALLEALTSNRLAAAYLDVTTPEPLPPSHPLWTAPNCHITPHTAGGHADEKERLVGHFAENLRRFTAGEPLLDRVM
jgi:phosphoglycerate dehydrogenase-like enzyme